MVGHWCSMLLSLAKACHLVKPNVNETGIHVPLLGRISNVEKRILLNIVKYHLFKGTITPKGCAARLAGSEEAQV